jgi:hypothetical protein
MIHLLLAGFLAAGEFSSPPSLRRLHAAALDAIRPEERAKVLVKLNGVPPSTLDDLRLLYDLYERFPSPADRSYVVSSLDALTPAAAPALEAGFIEFLKMEEVGPRLFGLKGLSRLRSKAGAPVVRSLAKRKLQAADPAELVLPTERDEWWLTYEALDALAAIEGEKARSLVLSQAAKAARAARIHAFHYWEKTLPLLKTWKPEQRVEALRASVPVEDLKKTRAAMQAMVGDPKVSREVRHKLALHLGVIAGPEEVAQLLKDREAAQDPDTKLFLTSALYASRDPQTVPLIKQLAAEHPDPRTRVGSLLQLIDMLPPAEARALLETALKNDPDAENQDRIKDLLSR